MRRHIGGDTMAFAIRQLLVLPCSEAGRFSFVNLLVLRAEGRHAL